MKIIAFCSIALIALAGLYSCGPSVDSNPQPTTLIVVPGAAIKLDSPRLYTANLSCGCPFLLKVTAADTMDGIIYDFSDFVDTIRIHGITAKVSSPSLSKGTHIGSLTFQTVQPVTNELLTYTVRDTIVVP